MSIPPPHGPQHHGGRPPPQFPHGGQPGFAPYGLYGPYGPRPPAAVDGVAIASLVFGVLCFLPAFGLVLGLIALGRIKRRGERGRGMAVAGSLLSSLGLALWTVALITGAAADFWEDVKEGARGNSILALCKGDCFNSPGGLEGWATDADRLPCTREHDGEVFAVVPLPDGAYPGAARLTGTAAERCQGLLRAYVMDTWALPGHVDVYHLTPSEEGWDFGDREITCVLGNRDAQAGLTGSLRRDATTLDAHQVAYLEAEGILGAALDEAPGSDHPEDDLPGHKEWAAKVADALAEESRLLREHAWPVGAEGSVGDLAAELAAAEEEWTKAAGAADADTYVEYTDAGRYVTDPSIAVTARNALGLTDTPPAYDEEAERAPESGAMKV